MKKENIRRFIGKRCICFLAAVLVVAAGFKTAVYHAMLAQASVSGVFRTLPVERSTATVTLTARIVREGRFFTETELLSNFARKINLSLTGEPRRVSYEGREELIYEKEAADAFSVIKLVRFPTEQEDYLYAEITLQNMEPDTAAGLREDMEGAAEKLGLKEISTMLSLTGSLSGELPLAIKDELTNKILERLYAVVSYEHRENDNYTVYGYTAAEKEYLLVGAKRVNIQAAIYYDAEEDRTDIVIASPVGSR